MPRETTTTWTCSRCGGTEVTDPERKPPAWRMVKVQQFDTTMNDYSGDLCRDCRFELKRFLEGADLIPAEGLPMMTQAMVDASSRREAYARSGIDAQ